MIELPWQARPLIHVSGSGDYARRVVEALGPLAALAPGPVPDPPTRAELIAALPAADVDRLAGLGDHLRATLDQLYPPLPDPVTDSYVSVHLAGGGSVAAGTVVLVRTTAAATVQYLLPRIVVDPQTLLPRLIMPPARSPHVPRAAFVRAGSSPPISIGLSVLGTLAWGLPPPWNVASAALVTLTEQLFNLPDPNATSPLQTAVSTLEKYVDQTEIGRLASQVRGFALYVQDQQAHLLIPIGPSPYVHDVLLPKLRAMTTPGGNSVYDAAQQLESLLGTVTVEQKKDALDLLIAAAGLQLVGLKIILQLDAAAAAGAEAAGDDAQAMALTNLWLDDYVNLEQAVLGADGTSDHGYADRVTAAITFYTKARVGQVSYPCRTCQVVDEYVGSEVGWTFTDDGVPNQDLRTHFVADTTKPNAGCCEDSHVEHGDEVDAARASYVAALADDVTRPRAEVVAGWTAALAEWREHLPPPAPTAAPLAAALPGGPPAPQGVGWVTGGCVQYAIGYVNSAPPQTPPPKTRAGLGPSGAGPAGRWLPIGATAFARLTAFPPDPTRMATHLRIYRRFRTALGQTTQWRIVRTVPVATTSYDDEDAAGV